eukprot:9084215-Pyramimonas_sp.AAC.1
MVFLYCSELNAKSEVMPNKCFINPNCHAVREGFGGVPGVASHTRWRRCVIAALCMLRPPPTNSTSGHFCAWSRCCMRLVMWSKGSVASAALATTKGVLGSDMNAMDCFTFFVRVILGDGLVVVEHPVAVQLHDHPREDLMHEHSEALHLQRGPECVPTIASRDFLRHSVEYGLPQDGEQPLGADVQAVTAAATRFVAEVLETDDPPVAVGDLQ